MGPNHFIEMTMDNHPDFEAGGSQDRTHRAPETALIPGHRSA